MNRISLLRIRQHVRPDQLYDLLETVLALEQRHRLGAHLAPVGRLLFPPGAHVLHILGIGMQPVDGRIMPRVGQLGVERPEAADEPARVLGDRLGEIAARRTDRADDADRTAFAGKRGRPRRRARRTAPAASAGWRGNPLRRASLPGGRPVRARPRPSGWSSRRRRPRSGPCRDNTRPG